MLLNPNCSELIVKVDLKTLKDLKQLTQKCTKFYWDMPSLKFSNGEDDFEGFYFMFQDYEWDNSFEQLRAVLKSDNNAHVSTYDGGHLSPFTKWLETKHNETLTKEGKIEP